MKAGKEYLASLNSLGLEPEGLLWARDKTIDRFVLVLITSQFDSVGPTEIYRLLTLAYQASVTPREINPFIVRLHSTNQRIVPLIERASQNPLGLKIEMPGPDGEMIPADFARVEMGAGDLSFEIGWIYHLAIRRVKPAERSRRWKRFASNVERHAA